MTINHTLIQNALRIKAQSLSLVTTTAPTRASTATYTDVNGIVQTAAINVVRSAHYVSGVATVLYEAAATNSIKWSRDLTNAVWTKVNGTGAATQNAIGLDGTAASATTITDTDGAQATGYTQTTTGLVNDSQTHCVSFWIKKDADQTRFPLCQASLSLGTAVTRSVWLNTQTGASQLFSSGSGTNRVVDGGLWWVVEVTVNNNSTGNTQISSAVYPARSAVFGVQSLAATGSCVVGEVQLELNTTAYTSPIFTTTAAVTRAADVDSMFSATATGYARQTGSFVTEGFIAGMEIRPLLFASNPVSTIITVTATTLTVRDARSVESAVIGRSIRVGMPSDFAWENVKFTPRQGIPYVEEQYIPGPMDLSSFGANGNITAEPMYHLNIYVPQNSGIGADGGYADALLSLFCPSTEMILTNGDKLFVRADVGPFRSQRQQASGNSVISLTIPLRIYTANAI